MPTTVHSEWVKRALNPEESLHICPLLLLFISHPPTWPGSNQRGLLDRMHVSHRITVQTNRSALIECQVTIWQERSLLKCLLHSIKEMYGAAKLDFLAL